MHSPPFSLLVQTLPALQFVAIKAVPAGTASRGAERYIPRADRHAARRLVGAEVEPVPCWMIAVHKVHISAMRRQPFADRASV